jgi:hypothetical protein
LKNHYEINPDSTASLVIYSPRYGKIVSTVDTSQIAIMAPVRWYAAWHPRRKVFNIRGKLNGKAISLHQLIAGKQAGKVVDHVNGNTLDNRKANLRLVSNAENQHNQRGARGYYWSERLKKFQAAIRVNGKLKYLGLFETAQMARMAYLNAKSALHPSAPAMEVGL